VRSSGKSIEKTRKQITSAVLWRARYWAERCISRVEDLGWDLGHGTKISVLEIRNGRTRCGAPVRLVVDRGWAMHSMGWSAGQRCA